MTITPENDEVTTLEAAGVLKVSRLYIAQLLKEGVVPFQGVGEHRRIRVADLMAYKARDDRERDAAMDQLVREAQEQDMGYGKS